jgi:hypothetical protein
MHGVEVVRHLVVRVRVVQGAHHAAQIPACYLHLQFPFLGGFDGAAGRADVRVGVLAGFEEAGALDGEGAGLVVADASGAGVGQRLSHVVERVLGDEDGQLVERLVEAVEEANLGEAEAVGQREGHAAGGRIEVGVDAVEGGFRLGQPQREVRHVVVGRHAVERTEEKGMMGDDEVGPDLLRLFQHLRRGVERQEGGVHRSRRVAHLQAHVVVVLRGAGRGPRFEGVGDVGNGRRRLHEGSCVWLCVQQRTRGRYIDCRYRRFSGV